MKTVIMLMLLASLAVLSLSVPEDASAQYYPYPDRPYTYEQQERERYRQEQQWRREERRRARDEQRYQQWYDEQYRLHMQRYMGGYYAPPHPGESKESYLRRMHQQCNIVWDRCARYCNSIQNPNRRAACVSNCNNELYECNRVF